MRSAISARVRTFDQEHENQLAEAIGVRMKPTAVRWRILGLMVIGSVVSYVLRLNVSIAGDAMMEDLAISPVQFGLVLSAFAWGYAIFQLPGGLIGE
jgi:sugar phosphate permease